MPNQLIPILCCLALVFFACEQPNSNNGNAASAVSADNSDKPSSQFSSGKVLEDVVAGPGEVKKSSSGRDFTHKRGSALSILNHRIGEDSDDFYSIIEDGIWQFQFIHDGSKMIKPESLVKEYLDFKDDLTYEKGKAGKVVETGKYHYSFKTDKVLMIPDDSSKNPQEWKTMFKSDVFMILVGTPEYGNNNFQMKLERRKSKDEL